MRAKFVFKRIGDNMEFNDDVKVSSMATAEMEIKEIITEFNEVEEYRYGDTKSCREFVKITEFVSDFFEDEE